MPEDWDAGTLVHLTYRTPDNRALAVKCLRIGDSVIVHWSRAGNGEIQSVEVPAAQFVADGDSGLSAFKSDQLPGLIELIAPGLDLAVQVRFFMLAGSIAWHSGVAVKCGERQMPNEFCAWFARRAECAFGAAAAARMLSTHKSYATG